MWTRKQLKSDAKIMVKKYWQRAVIVSLIGAFLLGMTTIKFDVGKMTFSDHFALVDLEEFQKLPEEKVEGEYFIHIAQPQEQSGWTVTRHYTNSPSIVYVLVQWITEEVAFVVTGNVFIILSLLAMFLSIFITNPLVVGIKYFYTKGYREEEPQIGDMFYPFREGRYRKIVGKIFLRDICLVLWTLLLIIPGIIKYIEYFYVDYLLMESPNLSLKEAIKRSKEMVEGDRLNIFVLQLSFVGWEILSKLLLNIPDLLLNPYMSATYARLYLVRKEEMNQREEEKREENKMTGTCEES